MLTRLKKRVQLLLAAQAKLLHKMGMTPNIISAMGILSAFLAGCFYWAAQFNNFFLIIAPLLLLLSGFFDTLDGIVARLCKGTTVFGGFLDSLLDRYADAFIFIAIITSGLCDLFWSSVALVGSLLVSYTRARAEATGSKMETIGFAERAERIIVLTIASFAAFFWFNALFTGIVILAVLTNLTVLQRTIYFYNSLK
ncbi:MAG: CDP-alcohol phosphatidyltransferase family protein [Candidatus Bathyarchaeota archaeon]|nr:MAG: CDP-alcohol phosphatidyltransferase family protein [Candidatus Bathyarchaeota archaeon]